MEYIYESCGNLGPGESYQRLTRGQPWEELHQFPPVEDLTSIPLRLLALELLGCFWKLP